MDLFTRAALAELVERHEPPCVSLFMPAHRGGAEMDPIRFRNLLDRARDRLVADGMRPDGTKGFLAPLYTLLEDATFWRNQSDGLAVFLASDFLRVYRLPWAFREEVAVDRLFHVTPVLPLLAGDGRFFVLSLSENGVRLFQGTRFTISPVDLKGVPRSLAEALRTHDRDEVLTFHSRPTSGGSWGAIFSGHGVGIDDAKDDLLRYFRAIDRGLHEVLRDERAPLVVASVGYFLPIYRQASTYPHLLATGIEGNPDRLSEKELHDRAWEVVAPYFQESVRAAVGIYRQAAGTGRATADIREIIAAATRGEVATLFVAVGKHRWGVLVAGPDEVSLHEQHEQGDVELLNYAAVQTLRHGRAVHALRPEEMPTPSDLAAIYHLPLVKHGK